MSLCACKERPRCEWDWCDRYADWTAYQPPWPPWRGARFKFMCGGHYELYLNAMMKPIAGLDARQGSEEGHKPSILDMMKLACAELSRTDMAAAETRAGIPLRVTNLRPPRVPSYRKRQSRFGGRG